MTETQELQRSLLTQDRPFEAQMVTFMHGKIEFLGDSAPVSWDELIESFREDDTRIQIITQLQEPFEGFTMLATCCSHDGPRPYMYHYVIRAVK